jgi:hypothetical protein
MSVKKKKKVFMASALGRFRFAVGRRIEVGGDRSLSRPDGKIGVRVGLKQLVADQ